MTSNKNRDSRLANALKNMQLHLHSAKSNAWNSLEIAGCRFVRENFPFWVVLLLRQVPYTVIEVPTANRCRHLFALSPPTPLDCSGQPNILGRVVGSGLGGRRNILGAGPLQDFFRPLGLRRVVRMNRQQDAAVLHPPLVTFSLVFGDAHSN